MSELSYHKLFIHDHLNARELSEVYFSEATIRGQLFIILELPKIKIDQQPLIDQIIREAANQFSQSRQENPELALEEILQRMNQLLPELIPPKLSHWLNTLDLALGIIADKNVYVTSIGNLQGLLIHHNQVTPILEKTTTINPIKIFSDIVSGELEEEDALIVSTSALFDYISQEKIRQIIKKYTPAAAVQEIKNLLETVPNFVNFNSIIIKRPSHRDVAYASAKPAKEDSKTSPDTLNNNLSKNRSATNTRMKTKLVVDLENIQKIRFIHWIKIASQAAMVYFRIVGKTCQKIWHTLKFGYKFSTSKQYRLDNENNLLEKILDFLDTKLRKFTKLTWQKKTLLIGFFVVTLVFLQSLVFLTQGKSIAKKDLVYDQTIQQINNALNDVQASLIYNDEKRAEELLLEIQAMLDGLQPNSQSRREEIAQAQDKTQRILNDVRHINYVTDPLQLYDLNGTVDTPRQIAQKDNKFYVLDKNKLYLLDNNQASPVADFSEGITMADWTDSDKLILGNNQEYLIYDTVAKTSQAYTFNKSTGNSQVQDVAVFNNNLYVLDTASSQIFKYASSGQSFSNGSNWLQENIDLSGVYSFTIDGDVYLMGNDGQINKLHRGRKEIYNYHRPHPLLGKNVIIKTFTDSNYLYLMDPDNKRIIIMDKEGSIKDQYTSPKFDNLIDLAVNNEENGIYLLNGSQVYLLAIN